jgi:hypothetical protein
VIDLIYFAHLGLGPNTIAILRSFTRITNPLLLLTKTKNESSSRLFNTGCTLQLLNPLLSQCFPPRYEIHLRTALCIFTRRRDRLLEDSCSIPGIKRFSCRLVSRSILDPTERFQKWAAGTIFYWVKRLERDAGQSPQPCT